MVTLSATQSFHNEVTAWQGKAMQYTALLQDPDCFHASLHSTVIEDTDIQIQTYVRPRVRIRERSERKDSLFPKT